MKNILRPRQGLSKRTLARGDMDLQGPLRETLHRLQEPPPISCDITQGVWGAPFQRNAEERRLWCDLLEQAEETSIVTVHCRIEGEAPGTELYIQRSTFLRDRCSGECARLLHTEGMPHPPEYVAVGARRVVHFTLYFEALPCHCSAFDLEEHSSDPFPFTMRHIERNSMDVYHVVLRENQNA
jgi:hypothetical protein